MLPWNSRFLKPLLCGLLSSLVLTTARAQSDLPNKTDAPVVVYPIVFDRNSGTTTSRAAAVQALREVMSKAGHPVLSDKVAAAAWKRLRIPIPTGESAPTARELSRFGKAMKARYVLGGHFDFHSRSIWVNLGPKTISTATADVYLFDVQQTKIVYSRQHVQGRSDEKTETLKVVAGVLVSPLVTAVSGGPKTPQERRAAQIAAARALQDWVMPGKTSVLPGTR